MSKIVPYKLTHRYGTLKPVYCCNKLHEQVSLKELCRKIYQNENIWNSCQIK